MDVVVLAVHGHKGMTATADLVKSGVVYGSRVQLYDPGVFLVSTLAASGVDLTEFAGAGTEAEHKSLAQVMVALEDMDIDSLVGLADRDLVELVEPLKREEIGLGRSVELFLDRFGALLQGPSSYLMLDQPAARVFRELASAGDFVLDPTAERRTREATTANGLLGRLPNFRMASLDDVIGVRETLGESLPRFRAGIAELSEDFEGEVGSAEQFGEVEEAWRTIVAPAVQEIEELTNESRFLRSLLSHGLGDASSLAGGGIGVVTAAAAGLDAVGSSLAAAAGTALGVTAGAIRDAIHDRQAIRRRRFYLLYEIETLLQT